MQGTALQFCEVVVLKSRTWHVDELGGNQGAYLNSISPRCHLFEVAFVWELTKETIHLPMGCLQGGCVRRFGWQVDELRTQLEDAAADLDLAAENIQGSNQHSDDAMQVASLFVS